MTLIMPRVARRSDESAAVPPSGVDKRLQPAVIGGLAVASAVVFAGFILLFVVWRRHHIRERMRKTEIHPESQLQSQDNAQRGKLAIS